MNAFIVIWHLAALYLLLIIAGAVTRLAAVHALAYGDTVSQNPHSATRIEDLTEEQLRERS